MYIYLLQFEQIKTFTTVSKKTVFKFENNLFLDFTRIEVLIGFNKSICPDSRKKIS